MKTSALRQRLLASTLLIGAATFGAPAWAQTGTKQDPQNANSTSQGTDTTESTAQTGPIEGQQGQPEVNTAGSVGQGAPGEEIVVTGSRIPQPNLTSASPVTVLSSQDIKLSGTTRTEDIINSLPQSFAAQGSNISNGATGTATVNLRNLGESRTLVLVNGRRLMPGDPRSPVADLNFIPALIVKRVDVLTGGASSVYGADAVAGVVNFIMDTNFEGFRVDAGYNFFNHVNDTTSDIQQALTARAFPFPKGHVADGGTYDVSAVLGTGFADDRGHVTAYATYRKQNAITQDSRDYSSCSLTALSASAAATAGRAFSCGGSSTSATGRFFIPTTGASFTPGPNRTFVPGFELFNFAPSNFFQRPDERYTFGMFANYEIADAVKPYVEAMFMDDRSVAQIAPSGLFFGNLTDIRCDSALLSAQQRGIVCTPGNSFVGAGGETRGNLIIGRRNVEGGGRQDDVQHTDYRIVGGLRGDIATGISYDAYYQYGRVNFAQTYLNDFSIVRLGRALDVVAGPNGQPVCRSTTDGTDANCVPYDIFTPGGVTPAALNYLQTPGFSRGINEEQVANASITFQGGEYGLQSPLASSGLALNFGAEYRKEKLQFNTDTEFSTGDLAGQGGPTIGLSGQFNVKEVFVEGQLPLIEDRPFFYQLQLLGGYRYSKYKVAQNRFSTNTYKLQAEYAPVRDIRFRGSYNRAVRAPNIVELFSAQSVGLAGSTDPCAGPAVSGRVQDANGVNPTLAQCALTGVTAAQFGNILSNPAEQYNALQGGNTNLSPETAKTVTLGVVIQPRFIPNFALTFDAFDIKLKQTIGVIGADTIINQCLSGGDPFFCSRIRRDQFGSLFITPNGFITDINSNVGSLTTRGIDANASYNRRIGRFGTAGLSFVGTYLDRLNVNPFGNIVYNCAGLFGSQCGTPSPKYRSKTRLTFSLPNGIGLSGQWRYFSKVKNEGLSSDNDLNPDGKNAVLPANQRIKAQSFFDLTLTARVGDHYQFRLGANNILDKDPPILATPAPFGNGNTYPQVYDSLGRFIYAGVTLDF